MQHFLRTFLDIVLWRRGPQDLPASALLVWLTLAAYVLVSVVQLALLNEPGVIWFVFVIVDPLMLMAWVWLVLRVYGRSERYVQTVAAVLGTGALLGLVLYLPLQLLVTSAGSGAASSMVQFVGLLLVAVFALVTGRILKLATDSSLFTGVAVSLTYFFLINLLVGMLRGPGT